MDEVECIGSRRLASSMKDKPVESVQLHLLMYGGVYVKTCYSEF